MQGAMGRGARRFGRGLLILIFTPLLLGLLFLMPAEFGWSSWHLLYGREIATGAVVTAEIKKNPGKKSVRTTSEIVYEYSVGGKIYTSTRVHPGFASSGVDDGGILAKRLESGDPITVHYAAGNPGFSFLLQGWPKWSIGFSLLTWGIIAAATWCPQTRSGFRPSPLWRHAFWKPLAFTGLVVLIFGHGVILVSQVWIPLAIHAAAMGVMVVYWVLRYPSAKHDAPTRWLRPRA